MNLSCMSLHGVQFRIYNYSSELKLQSSGRRSTEISLVIRQTMEASILTELMPRSQIDIFVQVLQADGGKRATFLLSDC